MGWIALALTIAATCAAQADYKARLIGDWITSGTDDRFGDGGTYIAMTGDNGFILAVRCLQKELSLAVMDHTGAKVPDRGDAYLFKLRVDKEPIFTTMGKTLDQGLVQLVTEKALVREMRDGRELALKVTSGDGIESVHIYPLRGARKAFADLEKECPLDDHAAGKSADK
jgi:hypothetical protein